MRRVAILLLVLCSAAAAAPDIGGLPEQVVFLGPTASVSVAAGLSQKVALEFRVGPTYHINSNTPKSELLIPTRLLLSPPKEITVSKLKYPAGLDASFPFAPTETLNVYAGRFIITAVMSTPRTTTPGTYRMRGTLRYQACDNRACYPPKQLPVEFDVKVEKSLLSPIKPAK
jgi:Thiol:disulfide interchange protein DsbD, N-terminal